MTTIHPAPPGKTALANVHVFDGRELRPPGTVAFEDGYITADHTGARVIDGEGGVLLPGLIDAHVHLHGRHTLELLRAFGVTTALDMATAPPDLVDSLRALPGLTDIRTAGTPAIAPGSPHSRIPVIGERGLITDAKQAADFVAARVAEGSDYIKIAIGPPAPSHDQATLDALVAAAHDHGKLTVAHASSYAAVRMALDAGIDVLTHAPLDRPLDPPLVERAAATVRAVIPTLTMMEKLARRSPGPGDGYPAARNSVAALYHAGVPVLAGTDANAEPGAPAPVRHGESLHRELELLVEAGLSTLDALRAATSLPAAHFGLADRGVIEPGRRADLVLIDGDPLREITATRAIRRVWCAGIETELG
jgi:imidazolonepropionase-like amidohydrolase